jgi:hypothetical protein
MTFTDNPYYYPEKCGLEILWSIDTAGDYEFDIFIIFKKIDDNTLWWDSDSGCSCPSPFDPSDNGHHLTPIDKGNIEGFRKILEAHYGISASEVSEGMNIVKNFYKQ